mgnify:CR=1 FL=1|tara:strand:- start:394 stop:765 length:372 start_codon:yes stop_codon:yes gene_type:complete
MEIIGKIKWVDETKEYGSKGFKKRELVITTEEQYPQNILVEFVQDKCDLLNSFQIDQQVKVSINLRGREWTNPEGQVKYFNSVQGWRIEKITDQVLEKPPLPPPTPFESEEGEDKEVEDDLPF